MNSKYHKKELRLSYLPSTMLGTSIGFSKKKKAEDPPQERSKEKSQNIQTRNGK